LCNRRCGLRSKTRGRNSFGPPEGLNGHLAAPAVARCSICRGRGKVSVPDYFPPRLFTQRRFEPSISRSASLAAALYSLHEVVGNKPNISSHFWFELRTSNRQCRLILLQMARFSPELWTPRIRYGSRNSSVSRCLWNSTKWGSVAPLEQARASDFEIAISGFESFRPSQAFRRLVRPLVCWRRVQRGGRPYPLCVRAERSIRGRHRGTVRAALVDCRRPDYRGAG
jgi:hypothetical protein